MALDGLVIHAIVDELALCVGGRISKIHQPSEHDVLFQIRAQSNNYKLLLSANPTYPRVHLTNESFINPLEAPMFCMLLRKYCESGIIESIEQVGMERIIHIHVRQRDELGDVSVKKIVIEMMGRHSNIILLDPANNNILDGIHHVTPAISSFRIVMPGSSYTAPPDQQKHNPLTATREQFVQLLTEAPFQIQAEIDLEQGEAAPKTEIEVPLEQKIVQHFSGISPGIAREIVHLGGGAYSQHLKGKQGGNEGYQENEGNEGYEGHSSALEGYLEQRVWPAFSEVMRRVREHHYEPTIIESNMGKSYFSVLPLTHIHGTRQSFSSISACLEAFYGDKAERDTVKQRVSDLLRFLQNEKNKNVKKLEKLADTIEEAKGADQYRIIGELLTASLHQVQRGDTRVKVINYYDEEQNEITITLDPQLSPSENAQRYFRKYNKMKNSLSIVQEQIAATQEEIRYIESIQQQLDRASISDIGEIREELIEQGYIRDRSKKTRKKKKAANKPVLNCYTSSEGIPIYVGKNNTQNEYVSNRLAHPSDTWLHTKDIPGSHVVIRGTEYGEKTLEEAAQLSAYFSQARESSQVPVDYTLIRHVRKPNGAKPGFVIYDHQKTLFVTPDEQLIKGLQVMLK